MTRLFPLILTALLLTSCAGDAADGRVTITFWHSFVSATRPALDDLISRFEDEHPDIRIRAQYIPTGDGLIQKLVTAIQSRTAPDLAWVHADFLDKLVTSDAIYPMAPFIHGDDGFTGDEMDDFFPGLLQAASWRDTLYAMPMEATSLALFYNRDLFRAAGLDPERPPQTWDELREYARRLTFDSNGDGRTDHFGFYIPVFPASGSLSIWMVLQWLPYLWQAGGEEIDLEQSRVLYDSEAGVQALTLWKEIYDDIGFETFSMMHDLAFATQRAAMIMDGPWDLPRFREMKDVDWAVAPLPEGPGGAATYLAGEHLAIFKQSRHPHEAWTFVKWVNRPDVQARFSMQSGYLPTRRSAVDLEEYREYLETDAALKAFVDQMPAARARRPIDFHWVEINRHIADAIERAVRGAAEVAVALEEAAARSNALLSGRVDG